MDNRVENIAQLPAFEVCEIAGRGAIPSGAASSEGERQRWSEQVLNLPAIWQKSRGAGVKVAVLDTRIDSDHPDLEAAIDDMRDFTGDGIEDQNGHGTHCAGVIAAQDNGQGYIGAAPEARLLIAKVLGNEGQGTLDMVADGVEWAVKRGADIISMSLGGRSSSNRLYKAIHKALADGVAVICAAGNEGRLFSNSIGYPGRYGGVITVAAHDRNGQPSGFSSHGGEVDFMAPGQDIWSAYKDGRYAKLSGTSMATPFVAALGALVLSQYKNNLFHRNAIRNNADLHEHFLRMAAHPGHHDNVRGYGPLLPMAYFGNF